MKVESGAGQLRTGSFAAVGQDTKDLGGGLRIPSVTVAVKRQKKERLGLLGDSVS